MAHLSGGTLELINPKGARGFKAIQFLLLFTNRHRNHDRLTTLMSDLEVERNNSETKVVLVQVFIPNK